MRADEPMVPSSVAGKLKTRNHRRGNGGSFASRLGVESRRAARSRQREHRHDNAAYRSAERKESVRRSGQAPIGRCTVGCAV